MSRTVVVVTTHNPMGKLRMDLLEQTVRSVEVAFPCAEKMLFDNGSDDGSFDQVVEVAHGWYVASYHAHDGDHTPGRARQKALQTVRNTIDDVGLVVCSDDDMGWRPGAQQTVEHFWSQPPESVAILCGYLEPDFRWSKPVGVIEGGGAVRALQRTSVPGAAWTFPLDRWDQTLRPLVHDGFGYDYKACTELAVRHLKVVAVDLCDHLGWEASSHGNMSNRCANPVDKTKWGLV